MLVFLLLLLIFFYGGGWGGAGVSTLEGKLAVQVGGGGCLVPEAPKWVSLILMHHSYMVMVGQMNAT